MLLELELPRLLAPSLPTNWYSIRDLNCSHSNCVTCKGPALLFIVTPPLPSLDVVAVSQAPSPKSCPNNLLPVKAMVVQYSTLQSWLGRNLNDPSPACSHAIQKVIMNHQSTSKEGWSITNKYYPFANSWVLMHVLALELLRVSK